MGPSVAQHYQQLPALKKRASIRDRFRALAKDTPSPAPEQDKRRSAYVPTHAAADFSRLSLSPRPSSRQQLQYSYDESRSALQQASDSLVPSGTSSAEDQSHDTLASRHYPPRVLQTLDENEPVQVISGQRQRMQLDPERDHQQPTTGSPSSRQQTTILPGHVSEMPGPDQMADTPSEKASQQLNDYELFLARAEERERAYRGQLLRTLSQRQYPRPEPDANHYRTSATFTADSAVVAETSTPLRRGWDGRLSGLDSGIGSKSSSQRGDGSGRPSEERAPPPTSNTWERGHRKRTSWTPSFGAAGREAERQLERGSPAVPELDEVHHSAYTTSGNHLSSFAERTYAAQQPRTVKRQRSITQKLGDYIKPVKGPVTSEEPQLRRGVSKRSLGV